MHAVPVTRLSREKTDDRGKQRHRDNGAHAEADDVRHCRRARRKRQRRNDAKEMRAPGDTVQHPEAEGSVCVPETLQPSWTGLHVQMVVLEPAMDVRGVLQPHASPQGPHADDDQGGANQLLAPS